MSKYEPLTKEERERFADLASMRIEAPRWTDATMLCALATIDAVERENLGNKSRNVLSCVGEEGGVCQLLCSPKVIPAARICYGAGAILHPWRNLTFGVLAHFPWSL